MASAVKRAFVGIDAGTTGCMVIIFDEHGNALGNGYQEYSCSSPQPGWIEQSLDDVWDGICSATRQAVAKADLPASAYHSIGLSSQRGTFGLLDENRVPLMNSLVWNCGRALKSVEAIHAAFTPEEHQKHTGMAISPLWSAAKIIWLRENRPELFEKTRWFVNGQEFFLWRMGADDWSTDPASLTLNGMMDIAKLDWSDRILDVCGIGRDRLPPVGIPAAQAGRLSRAAAEATGLPEGMILCRGAGDQQCAAIGAGVIRQGMAEFTVGTSGVMVAHLDDVSKIKGNKLWWGGHGVPGAWDIEGGAFSLGASLRWWRDQLGRNEVDASNQRGGFSPYSIMVEQAARSRPGANGAMFHSFMASQVTPYYDAVARGGFLGLGLYHERHDLIRALLEGCAHEMKMVFDAFQTDVEGGITDFRLTGGGTKSAGFAQIMTDVIGVPSTVTKERECTALGAAILGAYGSGAFSSINEAVGAMVQVESTFEPNQKLQELYGEQHAIYRGIYEAIAKSGQYAALSEFSQKYQ